MPGFVKIILLAFAGGFGAAKKQPARHRPRRPHPTYAPVPAERVHDVDVFVVITSVSSGGQHETSRTSAPQATHALRTFVKMLILFLPRDAERLADRVMFFGFLVDIAAIVIPT